MATPSLGIDPASLFDNADARQVEFAATVDGERRAFAAQYDLLRALSGEEPEERAVALFQRHADTVAAAAARALSRDLEPALVVVSENDLD